jgi:hypothetical protein
MWAQNLRFKKQGFGPIIQESRSRDVWQYFTVPEARMWAHNSRFQKQGCGPIISGLSGKDVSP